MTAVTSLHGRIDAVVIGASAGGVEALSALLPAVPADSRAPVFVVLHLPREKRSLLEEVFRARCQAAVHEASDKDPIEPGTVYFAPPDYHLLIERGPSLALSADGPVNFSRPSVDVLFESAADVYKNRLLGVILRTARWYGRWSMRRSIGSRRIWCYRSTASHVCSGPWTGQALVNPARKETTKRGPAHSDVSARRRSRREPECHVRTAASR